MREHHLCSSTEQRGKSNSPLEHCNLLTTIGQMQAELLEGLAANFATNEYRLLVIDSVMSLYRTDYIGRGELSERQQALGTFLRRATQMAEEFNLCVFMVSSRLIAVLLLLSNIC